jgi:hypothetical protein
MLMRAMLILLTARKAQTTKDLAKPWTLLPLSTRPAEIVVRSEADSTAEQTGLTASVTHSAMTTLLLDDSPAKARLQPYNHVCIPEYNSTLRGADLQRYEREKMEAKSIAASLSMPPTDNAPPKEDSKPQDQEMHTPKKWKAHAQHISRHIQSADISSSSSDSDLSVVGSTSAPVKQSSISNTERAHISSQKPVEIYDPTLLAVIGILDEIKKQSSVAGWIRGGGLWEIVPTVPEVEGEVISAASATDPSAIEDHTATTDVRATKILAKKELRMAGKLTEKQRKRAEKAARQAAKAALPAGEIQTGNDESSISDITTRNIPPGACGEIARMWFNDDVTIAYWVGRGRSALESLGIEAAHGVTG